MLQELQLLDSRPRWAAGIMHHLNTIVSKQARRAMHMEVQLLGRVKIKRPGNTMEHGPALHTRATRGLPMRSTPHPRNVTAPLEVHAPAVGRHDTELHKPSQKNGAPVVPPTAPVVPPTTPAPVVPSALTPVPAPACAPATPSEPGEAPVSGVTRARQWECALCLDVPVRVCVLVPCGHWMCACCAASKPVSLCHMCREPVMQYCNLKQELHWGDECNNPLY